MYDQLKGSCGLREVARDQAMDLNYSRAEFLKAGFIEPMLLLRTDRLPEGREQSYELKLDGYTALTIKTGARVKLRSRNDNDFNARYPTIVNALSAMPDETVITTSSISEVSQSLFVLKAPQNFMAI